MAFDSPFTISKEKIPALDGLRGAAILLVLACHFGLLGFGWIGVWLFFALSGFLITSLLIETKELNFYRYFGWFYWRRTLRIWPIYFLFILVVVFIFLLNGRYSSIESQLPWLSTFTYNFHIATTTSALRSEIFTPLWSISTEEQFYLFWPILVWLMPRKALFTIAVSLLIAGPLLRFAEPIIAGQLHIPYFSAGRLVYNLPFGQVDGFAVGAILALTRNAPWKRKPLLWGFFLLIPALLIPIRQLYLLTLGIPFPSHLGFPMGSTLDHFELWGYTAICLFFGGILILVLYGPKHLWLRQLCEWNVARFFGRISYGMYIFHYALLLAFERFMPLEDNLILRLLQWKLYLLILIGISWVSYRYYESWFLKQKERHFQL